jgi:hypothetical protein
MRSRFRVVEGRRTVISRTGNSGVWEKAMKAVAPSVASVQRAAQIKEDGVERPH